MVLKLGVDTGGKTLKVGCVYLELLDVRLLTPLVTDESEPIPKPIRLVGLIPASAAACAKLKPLPILISFALFSHYESLIGMKWDFDRKGS